MSDPGEPKPQKPIPLLIWVALGFVLVLGFMILLRALSPSGLGRGPAVPDVIAPVAPKTPAIPDVEPVSRVP